MGYKADFNQNFVKYRKLHNVLDQHSKRFAHLESQLKQHQRGSKEFKVSFGQIYVEFVTWHYDVSGCKGTNLRGVW